MYIRKLPFANSENIYLVYIIGMFFVAQVLYYFAHAGFHSAFTGVDHFYVDPSIIHHNFWQSLFYYHIAPPFYIMYSVFFIYLFPPSGELGFYFLHSALGIYAIYSLYKTQRRLDINPVLATFLTTIFILSPSFNLQQTTGIYDFPTGCLLTISVWRLIKLLDNPRFSTAFSFFAVIALLCSIRSLYHVVLYMIPVIAITITILKQHWKTILLGALIPFLFVFSVYFKNYLLFDVFTMNSFFGETLDTVVMQFNVSLPQREEGIKQGFFSDLALCPSSADTTGSVTSTSKFSGHYCYGVLADKYRNEYIDKLGKNYSDIPVLSCAHTIATAIPGVLLPARNCLGNIGMSREYQKNAFQAIIHYPRSYWAGVRGGWRQYFNSAVVYYFDIENNIRQLPKAISRSWLRYPIMGIPNRSLACSFPLIIALPFLFFFGVCYTLYSRRAVNLFLAIYTLGFISTFLVVAKRISNLRLGVIFKNWDLQTTMIMWLLGMLVAMVLAAISSRVLFLKKPTTTEYVKRIVVLYLLGNIAFTTLVITFLTGLSQERYRFYIDGMNLLLLSLFIQSVILPLIGKCTGRHKNVS